MEIGRARQLRTRTVLRVGVAVLTLVGVTTLHSSAAESTDNPGLPDVRGYLMKRQATGVTYDHTARQWIRTPQLLVAAVNPANTALSDPTCRRLSPFTSVITYTPKIFFRSPEGAPAAYGYQGPFTVRTLGFGAVPVVARMELVQERDGDDLPVPIDLAQTVSTYCSGLGPHGAAGEALVHTSGGGQLQVRIVSLTVDGVDVGLGDACRTRTSATITLTPADWNTKDQFADGEDPTQAGNLMTTPYFSVGAGGLLPGTIDIPAFTGCTTAAGDDVSRLLTATVSGTGNPMELRSQALAPSADQGGDCSEDDSCPTIPEIDIPTEAPSTAPR